MFLNIRDRYWFLSSEMGFFSFLEAVKKSCLTLFDMMYVMSFQINNVVFSLSNLMFFLILRKSCVPKSIESMKTFGQKKWLISRKSISRIKWSHTLIFFYFWLYSQILSSLGYCASSIKSERHWWIGEFDRQCFESLIMSYHTCEKSP